MLRIWHRKNIYIYIYIYYYLGYSIILMDSSSKFFFSFSVNYAMIVKLVNLIVLLGSKLLNRFRKFSTPPRRLNPQSLKKDPGLQALSPRLRRTKTCLKGETQSMVETPSWQEWSCLLRQPWIFLLHKSTPWEVPEPPIACRESQLSRQGLRPFASSDDR